jgi:hypothetical protein
LLRDEPQSQVDHGPAGPDSQGLERYPIAVRPATSAAVLLEFRDVLPSERGKDVLIHLSAFLTLVP